MFGRFVASKGFFFLCTILITFWTTATLVYAIRGDWKLVIGTDKEGAA